MPQIKRQVPHATCMCCDFHNLPFCHLPFLQIN